MKRVVAGVLVILAVGCSSEDSAIEGSYEVAVGETMARERVDLLASGDGTLSAWHLGPWGYRLQTLEQSDDALDLRWSDGRNDNHIRIARDEDGSLGDVSGERTVDCGDCSFDEEYGGRAEPDTTAPSASAYAEMPWEAAGVLFSEPVAESTVETDGPAEVTFSATPIEGSPFVSGLTARLDVSHWITPPAELGTIRLVDPSGNAGQSQPGWSHWFPVTGGARAVFDLAVDDPSVTMDEDARVTESWCEGACWSLFNKVGFLVPGDATSLTVRYRIVVERHAGGPDTPGDELTQRLLVVATAADGTSATLEPEVLSLAAAGEETWASEWADGTMTLPASSELTGVTIQRAYGQGGGGDFFEPFDVRVYLARVAAE
jgi:hypothetical protein